jgi:hypothetical protein
VSTTTRSRVHGSYSRPTISSQPGNGSPGTSTDHLLRHASSPNYTIRFGWQPGDFVLWDNQATWHYAVDDYGDGARVYRKVLAVEPFHPAPTE